jgi:LAO/AO transport system ATPase
LLTLVARGEQGDAIRRHVPSNAKRGKVVAFTGSAGVGKSSLIGRVIEHLRRRNETVAVLACDPQSSVTGGALLGDRLRMSGSAADAGVFIRSVAAAGGNQAIAEHLDVMISLLFAFGFETVLLETVGAGQGDTAVRDLADVLVVLLQPETGDELQWEEAGILEVADVVVVHKSDLPGAARVEAQVKNQLNLPGCREVPVLSAGAMKGAGLEDLWREIERAPSRK